MDKSRRWIWGAALSGAVLASLGTVRKTPSSADPGGLYYQATCAVVEANSIDGYVSNLSQEAYQVYGQVRFTFSAGNSMSHPDILVPASGIVPPGQTLRVARARLAFQLRPGETCAFDVKNGIRRL